MNRAIEILNAPRDQLIAYLNSWSHKYKDSQPDIELRLMAHRIFREAGPGPGPAAETVSKADS